MFKYGVVWLAVFLLMWFSVVLFKIPPSSCSAEMVFSTAHHFPYCIPCKCHHHATQNATTTIECQHPLSWLRPSVFHLDYSTRNLKITNNFWWNITDDVFPSSNVTTLELPANNIHMLHAGVFDRLVKLKVLDLSLNHLSSLPAAVFQALVNLQVLRLNDNQLHCITSGSFLHLDGSFVPLESLYLDRNPLFSHFLNVTSTVLAQLKTLKHLGLSHTGITALPDKKWLHPENQLQWLDLSWNNFSNVPTQIDHCAYHLAVLNLSGNANITTVDAQHGFPLLAKLLELQLSEMAGLLQIKAESLTKLRALQVLNASHNHMLTHIDANALSFRMSNFEEMKTWPPLKQLYLDHNALRYLDFHLVRNWSALEAIHLHSNDWSCECSNQWLLDELMPILVSKYTKDAPCFKDLECGSEPIEMKGKSLLQLFLANRQMRCLDVYKNRPEHDGVMLISMLFGVVTIIVLVALTAFFYQQYKSEVICRMRSSSSFNYDRQIDDVYDTTVVYDARHNNF